MPDWRADLERLMLISDGPPIAVYEVLLGEFLEYAALCQSEVQSAFDMLRLADETEAARKMFHEFAAEHGIPYLD